MVETIEKDRIDRLATVLIQLAHEQLQSKRKTLYALRIPGGKSGSKQTQ